jgi:hypothetical protein
MPDPIYSDIDRASKVPAFVSIGPSKITHPFILKYADLLNDSQKLFLQRVTEVTAPQGVISLTGVGSGKFLQSVLIGPVLKKKNVLLIVPLKSVEDTKREIARWTAAIPEISKQNLQVIASNDLSLQKTKDILFHFNPSIVVIDEAQDFKDINAARTKRLLRYLVNNLSCRLFVLSATLITSNVKDYFHLLYFVCRENSPLSCYTETVEAYQALYDDQLERGNVLQQYILNTLIKFPGTTPRQKLSYRLYQTKNIVSSKEESTNVPLIINSFSYNSPLITEAIRKLAAEWQDPAGRLLVSIVEKLVVEDFLNVGLYPTYEYSVDAEKKEKFFELRRQCEKIIRTNITYLRVVDSVKELKMLAADKVIKEKDIRIINEYEEAKKEYDVKVTVVELDVKPLVERLKRFMNEFDNCIFWVKHIEVGKMLSANLGIPFLNGKKKEPNEHHRFIILSINAYYAGKNLQAWNVNVLVEYTSNALIIEQLIGRTHRQGQQKPVYVFFNEATVPLKKKLKELTRTTLKISQFYNKSFRLLKRAGG